MLVFIDLKVLYKNLPWLLARCVLLKSQVNLVVFELILKVCVVKTLGVTFHALFFVANVHLTFDHVKVNLKLNKLVWLRVNLTHVSLMTICLHAFDIFLRDLYRRGEILMINFVVILAVFFVNKNKQN